MLTLGIDTSNYTTSCALYDSESGEVAQKKLLLPVKEGEKGLRQSDAVFHHTARLWPLVEEIFGSKGLTVDAIGVSEKPRDAEGSYMPCFLVGVNAARCVAAATGRPVYGFAEDDARALEIIGKCFPDRKIKGINCREIILEGGALHCLSQQMPV